MQEAIQFKLNLPPDVKIWLECEAKKNIRSQGAEVVACLRAAMARAEDLNPST
ncbi:hypothetical protein SAMN05421774_101804 [Gemmobacter megaterium]|uniref:Arc-like DNA binding domain-containing protein n=1 Tax=Gemmobacter megaterium TaxID=1086013 RepID=A0A1N7L005_9RHOB|nr:Arc domain-containing protein [Gemmobacter megaterium]GGE04818.1 hypothetical protein GCM10011345_07870 [Gemmobacter megaterium]SIS67163.1 hypothetical protein SAMN05421774_101804 [Gemmobacter megaterium]